jgi:8-oxo-dGTP pyrophosphatase MutT (NUDIX family)
MSKDCGMMIADCCASRDCGMVNVDCCMTNVACCASRDCGITNVACGIMFDPQGNILMGLRSAHGPNPNYWEFPGGQLEPNETLEECLRREWVEELNLHISIDRFLCTTTYNNISCHFFVGKIEDIENLRICVHQYIGFYNINDVLQLRLFDGDDKVIKMLL